MKNNLMPFLKTVFTSKTAETRESGKFSFIGIVAVDFSCDKHSASGVTLKISFLKNWPDSAPIYDDGTKYFRIKTLLATLYAWKLIVGDKA